MKKKFFLKIFFLFFTKESLSENFNKKKLFFSIIELYVKGRKRILIKNLFEYQNYIFDLTNNFEKNYFSKKKYNFMYSKFEYIKKTEKKFKKLEKLYYIIDFFLDLKDIFYLTKDLKSKFYENTIIESTKKISKIIFLLYFLKKSKFKIFN